MKNLFLAILWGLEKWLENGTAHFFFLFETEVTDAAKTPGKLNKIFKRHNIRHYRHHKKKSLETKDIAKML